MYVLKECHNFCCTKIENFSVSFAGQNVLKNINIHLHCGELTAIIGPNGAGKSTLLKAILGEIRHGGKLKFCDDHGNIVTPRIGYVPQNLFIEKNMPMSVSNLFEAFGKSIFWNIGKKNKNYISALNSLKIVNSEHLISKRLGNLSGGELQRVLLALAITPIPNLLLLDEPVSGVDRCGLVLFYDLLLKLKKNHDISIIVVSHDLKFVSKYADRVVLLKNEIHYIGTPDNILNDEKKISDFFGGKLQ